MRKNDSHFNCFVASGRRYDQVCSYLFIYFIIVIITVTEMGPRTSLLNGQGCAAVCYVQYTGLTERITLHNVAYERDKLHQIVTLCHVYIQMVPASYMEYVYM